MNYTRTPSADDSVFNQNWIQGNIATIEQTGNCVSFNSGIVKPADIANQIVVTVNNEDSSPQSYFIFNIAADVNKARYNITSAFDLINTGPTNFANAKYGRGFINYEVEGSSILVYLARDLIGLADGVTLSTGTCPNVEIGSNSFVIRNCLDTGYGYNNGEIVSPTLKNA